MVTKLATKIGILFRNRHNIPLTCGETFVKSLALPDFLYASGCFSTSLSLTQLGRLERMLKPALRSVYDTGFCSAIKSFICEAWFRSFGTHVFFVLWDGQHQEKM